MSRQEEVILTNMCMIYDNKGNVLVQDRVDKNYCGITFPGGHVERGESLTKAVIREVYEETGLRIESPRICGVKNWIRDDNVRYIVLFYKTNKFSGTLRSSEEGKVYWINREEMNRMKLANGMDKMLRLFEEENLSEYFFYKENGKWEENLI